MATGGDFETVTGVFSSEEINKNRQLIEKYRILTDGRPGWEQTSKGTVPPPWVEPSSDGLTYQNWKLKAVEDTPGTVTVTVGSISNFGYASSVVDITNSDEEFTPAAGDVLSLKFSDVFPTECTLSMDNEGWPSYPTQYDFDGEEAFTAYYYPLWHFTADGPGQPIAESVYGSRVVSDANFAVIQGIWEGAPTTNGSTVPVLVESFKPLPEFT